VTLFVTLFGLLLPRNATALLPELFRLLDNLFGSGPHAIVLGEIHPADDTRGIQQEFGRPGDILSILARARVQKVIAADDFCFRIG
jgi:hypothetical protein